jgi:hypothetical protein
MHEVLKQEYIPPSNNPFLHQPHHKINSSRPNLLDLTIIYKMTARYIGQIKEKQDMQGSAINIFTTNHIRPYLGVGHKLIREEST